jgi:hypothetical protein
MKKILFNIALILLTASSFAQDVTKDDAAKLQAEADKLKTMVGDSLNPWKLGGVISINGQQVSLSNWAAGGLNSISIGGLVNVFAKYKKGNTSWDNVLELGYGAIQQGINAKWRKSDDKIQLTSKYGHKASKFWYYSALVDARTQFTNGYNYVNDTTTVKISKFLAPAYALASLGMDYKPNSNFSIFISPITGKFTFVNDDSLARQGAYGVQKEIRDPENGGKITQNYKTHRGEFGAYLKAQYQKKVMENITFQTVLELFTNYLHKPQNVDVNWTTLTTFKVNKYVSANFSTQLLYDDDIVILRSNNKDTKKNGTSGPDLQIKEVLSVGFTYKF